MATRRYTRSLLPFLYHGLDVYSTRRSLDTHLYIIISMHSLQFLTFKRGLSQMLHVSRDRLHWAQDNVSPGHHHPRTLSHTKSNMHTCLEDMPGPNLADLEAILAKSQSDVLGQCITAYPETEKINSLFDRFNRKVLLPCCLVHLLVVDQRVFVIITSNGLQCICAHLIAQASRFVGSPGGYGRDALCVLQKGIRQPFGDGISLSRVEPENVELVGDGRRT